MRATVVIPTYNEVANIAKLIERILGVAPNMNILVVDDNSPDATGTVVSRIAQINTNVNLLSRDKKEGLGPAYVAGFKKAKKQGVNIIYGDPTDIEILDYAQVDEAKIIILAVPERSVQEAIVISARKLNRGIFIISRVHRQSDQVRMKDIGANLVVQPEFEASLSIIKKIYLWHKLDKEDIINKIRRLKVEHGIS